MRERIKFKDLVRRAVFARSEWECGKIVERYRKYGLNAEETWERVNKITGIERGEWEDIIESGGE